MPANRFDGVFANATLFHVPSEALPRVLLQLHATLKPRGVLFASAAGFAELTHYYRPAGLPRAQQPWLASVWRKAA